MFAVGMYCLTGQVLAHDPVIPSSIEHLPLERVSDRIYVVHGSVGLPNPHNRGFMNNPAAILSDNGVIIVDPGSSVKIGNELLKKIRTITQKPVIAVLNTHIHGDHWLGNHAIRSAYPKVPIYAHARMIERIKAGEGEEWIKLFMDMTEGALAGTKIVAPNIGLKGGETLNLDGIALRIHHTGKAHTDHDIVIEVIDDKSMITGDIVTNRDVPSSYVPRDAYFKGQIKAIRAMLDTHARVYIPGHGRTGGREVPKASLRFLELLYSSVEKHYKQGLSDFEMKDGVTKALSEFNDWHNFNELGRVISHVYLEVEAESF